MNNLDYAANFAGFHAERPKDMPFSFWYGGSEPHRSVKKGIGREDGMAPAKVEVPPFLPDITLRIIGRRRVMLEFQLRRDPPFRCILLLCGYQSFTFAEGANRDPVMHHCHGSSFRMTTRPIRIVDHSCLPSHCNQPVPAHVDEHVAA